MLGQIWRRWEDTFGGDSPSPEGREGRDYGCARSCGFAASRSQSPSASRSRLWGKPSLRNAAASPTQHACLPARVAALRCRSLPARLLGPASPSAVGKGTGLDWQRQSLASLRLSSPGTAGRNPGPSTALYPGHVGSGGSKGSVDLGPGAVRLPGLEGAPSTETSRIHLHTRRRFPVPRVGVHEPHIQRGQLRHGAGYTPPVTLQARGTDGKKARSLPPCTVHYNPAMRPEPRCHRPARERPPYRAQGLDLSKGPLLQDSTASRQHLEAAILRQRGPCPAGQGDPYPCRTSLGSRGQAQPCCVPRCRSQGQRSRSPFSLPCLGPEGDLLPFLSGLGFTAHLSLGNSGSCLAPRCNAGGAAPTPGENPCTAPGRTMPPKCPHTAHGGRSSSPGLGEGSRAAPGEGDEPTVLSPPQPDLTAKSRHMPNWAGGRGSMGRRG